MARQIIETLVDDMDGSPADGSISFGLDGQLYTIDLNAKHENELRTKLGPYLEVARRVRAEGRGGTTSRSASNRERNAAIREWALSEGVELPARGRIARVVEQAYVQRDGAALRSAAGIELEEKPRRRR